MTGTNRYGTFRRDPKFPKFPVFNELVRSSRKHKDDPIDRLIVNPNPLETCLPYYSPY